MSDIIATLQSTNADSFASDEERIAAMKETYALLSRLESPGDTSLRLTLTNSSLTGALKIAGDLSLFKKWIDKNDGQASSAEELFTLVTCDHELFMRLVRHLTASYMILVDDNDLYTMTPYTTALVKENLASAIDYFATMAMPLSLTLPTFLKNIDYRDPKGGDEDCFTHWKGKPFFEYIATDAAAAANIAQFMQATSSTRGTFSNIYPCTELRCSKDEPLIVDIGGSMGHDLQAFKNKHPNIPGQLILQDLPSAISNARKNPDLDSAIETQEYDFFTPQPVQGSNLYLLHSILHDWPDTDAERILQTLRSALKPGHSKLLIHEVVVQSVRPDIEATTRDWVMMYMNSGRERSEEQWKSLLERTGFRIIRTHRSPLYAEAVIEAEVA